LFWLGVVSIAVFVGCSDDLVIVREISMDLLMRHSCCKAPNTKQSTAEDLNYSLASLPVQWTHHVCRSADKWPCNANGELL